MDSKPKPKTTKSKAKKPRSNQKNAKKKVSKNVNTNVVSYYETYAPNPTITGNTSATVPKVPLLVSTNLPHLSTIKHLTRDLNVITNIEKTANKVSNESKVQTVVTKVEAPVVVTVEEEYEKSGNDIKNYIDFLLRVKSEEFNIKDMKEKIICIKYYYEKQTEVLLDKLKRSQEQMEESKTKYWCAICHQLAEFYCCLRFYCSQKCQIEDWNNGHQFECLTRLNSTAV